MTTRTLLTVTAHLLLVITLQIAQVCAGCSSCCHPHNNDPRDDGDSDSDSSSSHSQWSTSSCVSSTSASSTGSQTSSATTAAATVTTTPVVVQTGVRKGTVAGIVIGVVAALAALLLLALCLRRRNRRRSYLLESESNMNILAGAVMTSAPSQARPFESDKVLTSSPPVANPPQEHVESEVSRIHALAVAAATSYTPSAGSLTSLPAYTQLPRLQMENLSATREASLGPLITTDDSSLTRPLLRPPSVFSLPNPHSPITPPDVGRFSLPLSAHMERDLPSVPHSPTNSDTHMNLATSAVISSAITREMIAGGSAAVTSDADPTLRDELAVHQKQLEAIHRAMRITGNGVVSSADAEADPPPEYREADGPEEIGGAARNP